MCRKPKFLPLPLLVILTWLLVGSSTAQYERTFLTNQWKWTPAAGPVVYYQVDLSYDTGENWEVLSSTVPPDRVDIDGVDYVLLTVVSPENTREYHLRVRATDGQGLVGPWSEISSLSIEPPGKPEIVEP